VAAEAEARASLRPGINLPGAQATTTVCLEWMSAFEREHMEEGPQGWRFKVITKAQAIMIDARMRSWLQRVPSLESRIIAFHARMNNAYSAMSLL